LQCHSHQAELKRFDMEAPARVGGMLGLRRAAVRSGQGQVTNHFRYKALLPALYLLPSPANYIIVKII